MRWSMDSTSGVKAQTYRRTNNHAIILLNCIYIISLTSHRLINPHKVCFLPSLSSNNWTVRCIDS
jgi:hypothetical protein